MSGERPEHPERAKYGNPERLDPELARNDEDRVFIDFYNDGTRPPPGYSLELDEGAVYLLKGTVLGVDGLYPDAGRIIVEHRGELAFSARITRASGDTIIYRNAKRNPSHAVFLVPQDRSAKVCAQLEPPIEVFGPQGGKRQEFLVAIPEGWTVKEVDDALFHLIGDSKVIEDRPGDSVSEEAALELAKLAQPGWEAPYRAYIEDQRKVDALRT